MVVVEVVERGRGSACDRLLVTLHSLPSLGRKKGRKEESQPCFVLLGDRLTRTGRRGKKGFPVNFLLHFPCIHAPALQNRDNTYGRKQTRGGGGGSKVALVWWHPR